MAWYDYLTSPFSTASAVTGNPTKISSIGSDLGSLKNTLQGDPASAVAGLDQLQQNAYQQGTAIKNFLMGQKGQSEAYYKPMQQMFGRMYGAGGIMPPKAPSVPGSTPIGGGGA